MICLCVVIPAASTWQVEKHRESQQPAGLLVCHPALRANADILIARAGAADQLEFVGPTRGQSGPGLKFASALELLRERTRWHSRDGVQKRFQVTDMVWAGGCCLELGVWSVSGCQ